MRKTIGILLAVFVVFSACVYAASAAKPENPGKPEEIVIPAADQIDSTPANIPETITPGEGIDWLPDV